MKLLYLVLTIFLVLNGCSNKENNVSIKSPVITTNDNNLIKVTIVIIEKNENGIRFNIELEDLSEDTIDQNMFYVILPDEIETHDGLKLIKNVDKVFTETTDNKLIISQFYDGIGLNNEDYLSFSIYISPDYLERDVLFELNHTTNFSIRNGMTLQNIEVDKNKLHLFLNDVHPTPGIQVRMLLEGEAIFPVFSNVENNNRTIKGSYEFMQPIPEQFTIIVTRHNMERVIWEFPFLVPL